MLTVDANSSIKIGEALIERKGNKLALKDAYTQREFTVFEDAVIEVMPSPPLYVPKKITNCLYLQLNIPIVVRSPVTLRVTAPFELIVLVDKEPLLPLSPFRVKHTVVGSPAEGLLCRWFPSELITEPEVETVAAALELKVNGKGVHVIEGILVENVGTIKMHSEATQWVLRVYYGPLVGKLDGAIVKTSGSGKPLGELSTVLRVLDVWSTEKNTIFIGEGP